MSSINLNVIVNGLLNKFDLDVIEDRNKFLEALNAIMEVNCSSSSGNLCLVSALKESDTEIISKEMQKYGSVGIVKYEKINTVSRGSVAVLLVSLPTNRLIDIEDDIEFLTKNFSKVAVITKVFHSDVVRPDKYDCGGKSGPIFKLINGGDNSDMFKELGKFLM